VALQDLTPQLRTRLSRLERVVGLFVGLATLLMVAGLAYYVYQRAERRGTFDSKVPYFTFARSAAGLKVGQSVMLMGREVGEITEIELQPPGDYYDVFVAFKVKEPYFGYLWEDSRVKIVASDFLGGRVLELTKGTNGPATYLFRQFKEVPIDEVEAFAGTNTVWFVDEVYDETGTNILARPMDPVSTNNLPAIIRSRSITSLRLINDPNPTRQPTGIWDHQIARYRSPETDEQTRKGYFLVPDEAPALADRLEKVVNTVESALPNILDLTNRVNRVLDNSALAALHADELLVAARPIVADLNQFSKSLSGQRGALGDWLLPPEMSRQITVALSSANSLLTNSDARVTGVAVDLDRTLANLATITANLRAQVTANTNIVGGHSRLIIHTDDMVQGLKRHWLLRSAFKDKPGDSAPSRSGRTPARSPRDMGLDR
jgi:ABC-type transporter Mla subunit MlaD